MRRLFSVLIILVVTFLGFSACEQKSQAEIVVSPDTDSCETSYDTAYAAWMAAKATKIDSFFIDKLARHQFNGTVLFADQGNVIIRKVYGYANIRAGDTLTLDSRFQLASVSKPITAMAVLYLADQGYLSLEDSIQKYYPLFPYEGITIRMLLTHRSGLPNYMYFSEDHWLNRQQPITNQDVVCLMQTYQPTIYYLPDFRYNYSNTNYALLAAIIEKVSGHPFRVFMEDYFFDILQMYDTQVYAKAEGVMPDQWTVGYDRGREAEDNYLNGVTGDKGVYSTVDDLFKLDQALYQPHFLSNGILQDAFTAANPELHAHDNYGLGWRINEQPDCSKMVYHSGWWKGYRTHFIRILDKEQTIIVLSNVNRSRFIKIEELVSLLE
ncbi:MAG: serine hydrolase domain-containing protein [Cyclobacteriaceae bacterium]